MRCFGSGVKRSGCGLGTNTEAREGEDDASPAPTMDGREVRLIL